MSRAIILNQCPFFPLDFARDLTKILKTICKYDNGMASKHTFEWRGHPIRQMTWILRYLYKLLDNFEFTTIFFKFSISIFVVFQAIICIDDTQVQLFKQSCHNIEFFSRCMATFHILLSALTNIILRSLTLSRISHPYKSD